MHDETKKATVEWLIAMDNSKLEGHKKRIDLLKTTLTYEDLPKHERIEIEQRIERERLIVKAFEDMCEKINKSEVMSEDEVVDALRERQRAIASAELIAPPVDYNQLYYSLLRDFPEEEAQAIMRKVFAANTDPRAIKPDFIE